MQNIEPQASDWKMPFVITGIIMLLIIMSIPAVVSGLIHRVRYGV